MCLSKGVRVCKLCVCVCLCKVCDWVSVFEYVLQRKVISGTGETISKNPNLKTYS